MNKNLLHEGMDDSTDSDSRASTLRPISPTNTQLTLNDTYSQTPKPPLAPSTLAIDTSSVRNLIRTLNLSNLDAFARLHPGIFSINHWSHRHQVIRRLHKELSPAAAPESCKHYTLHVIAGSLQFLLGSIEGTPGSPYAGGIFHILIIIRDYPFAVPKFQFLTSIYHPNVNAHGKICLDI